MSDDQPRAEWVFPEEKKSNAGRVWLIIGLSVAAIAIVVALLIFFIPRSQAPEPTPSPSPSPSPTATRTATPTPTPTAEPLPTSPPPMPDPDLSAFAAQVQPRLDDASTGLSIAAETSGQDASQVIETLQQDAGRLSDAAAPSSISSAWYDAVGQYSARLGQLREAFDGGADTQSAMDAAAEALQQLRALVGL